MWPCPRPTGFLERFLTVAPPLFSMQYKAELAVCDWKTQTDACIIYLTQQWYI